MAIPTLGDDVELEAENIKNANDLKGVKCTFSSTSTALLYDLLLEILQRKINAASNLWRL